ncbi:MAG: hypothetical protein C0424_03615 [Sphingobacteriaceae bacterium]|nr:hypothetical protein [Sphingobacteriaceae bacterium]
MCHKVPSHTKLLVVLCLFFCSYQPVGWAQVPNDDATEDWLLQQGVENTELPQELIEEWQQLAENTIHRKIDLNRADKTTLLESGKLRPHEIDALLTHRYQFGAFIDWYELQAIRIFDAERLKELSAWFVVIPGHQRGSWRQSFSKVQHRWLFRTQQVLEPQAGFAEERKLAGRSHYLGPQHAFRSQYRQQGEMHQAVVSISRDAGERGIDQLGGHLLLQSNGRWKRVVVGDYHLRLGEGLIANTTFGNGRGVWLDQFVFNGSQLRGASGLQNFGAYRGVAGQMQINKHWQWMPWIFAMRWSGQWLEESTTEENSPMISSIRENGLHRTATEWGQRKNVAVWGMGSQLLYSHRQWQVSVHGQHMQLPGTINRSRFLHQKHWPQDPALSHLGFSHRFKQRKWHSQGEVAWQSNHHWAILQQLYAIPHSKVQLRLAGRWYAPSYLSYYANSLHRGSRVNNEQGLLFQMQYQYNRAIQLAFFSDWVYFPWMRYQVSAPSRLREERLSIRYDFSKTSSLLFQLRTEHEEGSSAESGIRLLQWATASRSQLRYRQQLSEHWEMQWWWGRNLIHNANATQNAGLMAVQLRYRSEKWGFASQFSLFDAEHYHNRFYLTEPDLLYGMGMSSLMGQGQRLVALVQYKSKYARFWLRYARTTFADRQTVGSALDASDGNVRSQISLQCQLQIR